MQSGSLTLLLVISLATANSEAAEIPGSAHAEARELLAAEDAEGAVSALDAIVSADRADAEALVLRGAAHELAGKRNDAWQDYHDAAALMRNQEGAETELVVAATDGSQRSNGLLTAMRAARQEAVSALESALVAAKVAGDWEVARQAAVAILRLDPFHGGAGDFMKDYWKEPSLRGHWIDFFDPSLRNSEKPEGVWEALTDRHGFEFSPNGEALDTAEMLLPVIDAPQDNYQLEATFEVQELNTTKERTLALGWGRGNGSTLVVSFFADGRIGVFQQKGVEFAKVGGQHGSALPNEGREFTILLTVQDGDLRVDLNGEEVLVREGLASELSGLPFLLNTQNTRTRVWNLRFRYRPADGDSPDKNEVKAAAKAIKRGETSCIDDVDAMLADSPNDVGLLLMRAEAAAALKHKDAVMHYRRVLEESAEKKQVKAVTKALKKLGAENPVQEILQSYARTVGKAKREAPRGFGAGGLRVLEAKASVVPLEKADAKAWQKLPRNEKTEGEWTELSLDPGEACSAESGDWRVTSDGVEASGSTKQLGILSTSCTASDSFDLSFDYRFQLRNRTATGFQIWLGEPALVWKHGFPAVRLGLTTSEDLTKDVHLAKKRVDADSEWHTCQISVEDGFTSMALDGVRFFRAVLPPGHENLSGRPLSLRVGTGPILFRNLRYRDRW